MTGMPMIATPPTHALAHRVRRHLQRIAGQAAPITYRTLAEALDLRPPNTIHQVTEALEHLMREDSVNGHPFIAALVVSRTRGGLPAPGFFETASALGRFVGEPSGPEASVFYRTAFAEAVSFWSTAHGPDSDDVA